MYIFRNSSFTRRIAISISLLLLMMISGCGGQKHLDFPNNQLNFPTEGGTQSFSYQNHVLKHDKIIIDGVEGQYKPIYQEGIYVGCEVNEWLRLIERDKNGNYSSTQTIEALPNTSGKARMAEIHFYIDGPVIYNGEVFVYQTAQ